MPKSSLASVDSYGSNAFNLLASLVIHLLVGNAAAEMTGKYRSDFVESFTTGCYKTQRAGSVNALASDTFLMQFCKCSSVYIADLLNNDLWLSILRGEQRLNSNLTEASAVYCRNNYFKY